MKLRILSLIAGLAAILTSCGPQAFSLNMEVRQPSDSGLRLEGKSVAVVYLEKDLQKDSLFNEYLANGFTSSIEAEYFEGATAVSVYKLQDKPGAKYSSADSLIRMVVDTDCDVVFLFDSPKFGEVNLTQTQKDSQGEEYCVAGVPMETRLYAFDSMSGSDSVYVWKIAKELKGAVYSTSVDEFPDKVWQSISLPAEQVGIAAARIFLPQWKNESVSFVYYESPYKWHQASELVCDYRFDEAIKLWIKLLDTNNMLRRSCAEYNIAMACYLLGDIPLAEKWLNRSDEDYPLSLSAGLRKRIEAKK